MNEWNAKLEVVVIDFGGQYTQLLAKQIRQLGYYTIIVSHQLTYQQLQTYYPNLKALILSGGPDSVYWANSFQLDQQIWSGHYVILGICYGMQLLVHNCGGQVVPSNVHEYGPNYLSNIVSDPLTHNIGEHPQVWMSHGDEVVCGDEKFQVLAQSEHAIAIVKHKSRPYYGVQFHPEVTHTSCGTQILRNFCHEVAHLTPNWSLNDFVSEQIAEIQKTVKHHGVLLALSGGVDSSVAAYLLHQAIGKQLHCVFIDHGLLREQEVQQVLANYRSWGLNLTCVNGRQHFFQALKNVTNPEKKRQIIGQAFIDLFTKYQNDHLECYFLAQGTIASDVIESAASSSFQQVIKSHHNVKGLPEEHSFQLIEPLRTLFKNEVRQIGLQLGIDPKLINRHPFPGPGLGIRVIGKISAKKVAILQKADAIFLNRLIQAGLYDQISQAGAILLPTKAVGVVGDKRRYGYTCVLRAVNTDDFMTAHASVLTHEFLTQTATAIINQIPEISRVLYDYTAKPPGTIEWE